MKTIFELERELDLARVGESEASGAKYHTGIIIDLASSDGNVFSILGQCQRLLRMLGIEKEWPEFHRQCLKTSYADILEHARRQFGFIYINEGAE
jgi:hypothetical protein